MTASRVSFYLPEPPSANRWWRNVNGRMVTSKAAREYKETVLAEAINRLGRRFKQVAIEGPVRVEMFWYRSRKSGDLDKRIGIMLDALQGIAYEKDAQVTELHAYRRDESPKGTVVVHIERAAV